MSKMDLKKEFEDLKKGQNELRYLIQNKESANQETPIKWLDLNGLSNYLPSKPAHTTIYSWLSKNTIPAHKQGSRWIFSVPEIDEWIKSGKQKATKELASDVDDILSNKNKGL